MTQTRSISFHRQYYAYTGGHQKVHDYLLHTTRATGFAPDLFLDNKSAINTQLFDNLPGVTYSQQYRPDNFDVAFLAGMDWQAYAPFFDPKQVKINLIQHVRHGDPKHPLHQFLQHRAVRLCVSEAVKQAIEPYANGPCIAIKMGYQMAEVKARKTQDLYILATKQPKLGKGICQWAQQKGLSVVLHDSPVERRQVHQAMAESRVTLTLPNKTEGFYLPGIEAMALSGWAIVPDCIASREYTLKGANISSCELSMQSCQQAVEQALAESGKWLAWLKQRRGRQITSGYQLDAEGEHYRRVLKDLDALYS